MENQTVQINVEGMTCGNCALTISKLLEKKGATHVTANAASGEVIFTTPEGEQPDKFFDAINGLGYRVKDTQAHHEEAGHEGHHHGGIGSLQNRLWVCVLLTLPLLAHMFTSWSVLHNPYVQWALSTPVFIIGMITFLPSAYRSLKNGLPNMDVLIAIGAIAAYAYSVIGVMFFKEQAHDYLFFETAASIITLVMVGNWLEQRTVQSTTSAIKDLSALQPQKAKLILRDSIGKETQLEVDTQQLKVGDIVAVVEGDSIPVDGVIESGEALIDESMITGESEWVTKTSNAEVVGGTIIQKGTVRVQTTAVGAASVLQRIVRMVQEAQSTKPPLQKLADKISGIFVPAVLLFAIGTFLVNYFLIHLSFPDAMMRAIAVLVISCPCAMGLATPAAVAVGLGRAARMGILVKGGDTLERLKTIKQIVFDKTGTLTTGELTVREFKVLGNEENLQSIIVQLEQNSVHPIAQSIAKQWKQYANNDISDIEEVKGKGMQGKDVQGNIWRIGSTNWAKEFATVEDGYDLYLTKNNEVKAMLNIADEMRPDAVETIAELKEKGYRTILLSGDRKVKAEQVGKLLGMDEIYAEHSPEEKHNFIAELNKQLPTAMVGDGINDAPALANATVGISFSKATQVAIQSANIIITGSHLSSLPKALTLGRYTEQTIKQNLFWAFIYNIVAIPVAAVGMLKPTFGAGIMALSDVVLILNSLRLRIRKL